MDVTLTRSTFEVTSTSWNSFWKRVTSICLGGDVRWVKNFFIDIFSKSKCLTISCDTYINIRRVSVSVLVRMPRPTDCTDSRLCTDGGGGTLMYFYTVRLYSIACLIYCHLQEIWETLVANPQAITFDRDLCFEWFENCLSDLENDTQREFFLKMLLQVPPSNLTIKGFDCFKAYFESVNHTEGKLRKGSSPPYVSIHLLV